MYTADEVEDIGPSAQDRVKDLAAALDGGDVPLATVVEEKEVPAEEEGASPPTSKEIEKLRKLMDKYDVEFEEAERFERMIKAKDGPGVRQAIRDLQKKALELEL